MPTRNVVITDHQQRLIDRLVASGRYQNASEVLREGLRLLEKRMAEDAAKLKALREAVQVGIDAYERGEYITLDGPEEIERYFNDLTQQVLKGVPAK